MARRTVTVLQDDIDNGTKRSTSACPIARAVQRELPDLDGVHVNINGLLWPPRESTDPRPAFRHAQLPREAKDFICNFDDGRDVEPFKFEVEIAEEKQR